MAKPLGYRTTALDALRGADLSGKVAVVTGEEINGPRPPMRGPGRAAALTPSGPCLLVPPACCDRPPTRRWQLGHWRGDGARPGTCGR